MEMEQELQTLRFELEDEGKAMLGIVGRIIILSYLMVQSSIVNLSRKHQAVYLNFGTSE